MMSAGRDTPEFAPATSGAHLASFLLITTLTVSCQQAPRYSFLDHLETASIDSDGASFPSFRSQPSTTELLRLGGETLPALTPAFPSRVSFPVSEVPLGSVFEFSFAMVSPQPVPRARVEYRVTVEENQRPPIGVFREPLRVHQANQWHQGVVDLKPWIGKEISLVLEIRPLSTARPVPWSDRILTAWGNPRLSSRSRDRRMDRAMALARGLLCPFLGCEPTAQERPSVIILMVDALRADYLGTYGFHGEVSPNLDRLAVESILFENCFSQAPWTKPSIASLFTALYPLAHGLTDHLGKFRRGGSPELRTGVLAEQALTMAEAFQAAGYRTAAFVGNSWMGPAFGFDQGFESYEMSGKTRVLLDKARAWLDPLPPDAPFFLYLHLMDVHAPYYAREKDYRALRQSASLGPDRRLTENEYEQLAPHVRRTRWAIPEDQEWLNAWKAKYAGSVRSLDRRIAPFLEYLRLNDILDQSLVVLTSDHGDEFLEHGFWTHGADLCRHQLHVPLSIRRPEADGAGRRVSSVVSLVDLMPTLLAMTSIEPPSSLQGRDFSSLLFGEDAFPRSEVSFATATTHTPGLHAVQDGRYRLLWHVDTDQLRLFDDASGPEEVGDISLQEPMVVERLRSLLVEHLEWVSARGPLSRETAPMTKEVEERLKSLGYLQ